MRIIKYLPIACLLLILFSCQSSSVQNGILTVIRFNETIYNETNPKNIVIYNSRLELKNKFYEIGVIKLSQGKVLLEDLIQRAAKEGADALVKDTNNYTLIKYINNSNKTEDVKYEKT